jgi:thiol-disulfide isomerase/thioredoxin
MRANFHFLLLLCMIPVTTNAQNDQLTTLMLGDAAPPLQVSSWLKGEPVQKFEKGKLYIVEFWATWCKPCIAAMPHLSDLARQYNGRVNVLSINVDDKKKTSTQKVKAFVDSVGERMDYNVAIEENDAMTSGWLAAAGEGGIPTAFVVDKQGRLAWFGHPTYLPDVLSKIVADSWNINEALAKRKLEKHLQLLDDSLNFELMKYRAYKASDIDKPDSALLLIDEILKKEPGLKYAFFTANHTFTALLKTDVKKAYQYANGLLTANDSYQPECYAIIGPIEFLSDKIALPYSIYELGAKAYEVRINQIPYTETFDIPTLYMKMAQWYWRGKNKTKAIEAMEKSIEALKRK